jgi:Amt family ammonium transporter
MKKTSLFGLGIAALMLFSSVVTADTAAPAAAPAAATATAAAPAATPAAAPAASATPAAPAAAAPAPTINTGDTAWLLISSALVLLMTPGLALFYGGLVRSKNALNMFMKSFIAMALVSVIWVVVGYSLAFTKGTPYIGNLDWAFLQGVGLAPNTFYGATVPHQLFMIFQMMFAIITPALISGSVAERMKFSSFVVFMTIWSVVVYSPLAHMVWGEGGYLRDLGALDFAGGTVVHISSGFSGLVLAILLGKRKISHNDDTRPHNLPFTLLGAALLWFGWFGFNAGSAIASNELAVSAFVVTHIAAATAALTWVLIEWVMYKKSTALGLATGAVAGLVAITPASGFVDPIGALAIGFGVSVVCLFGIRLKHAFGYDDSLDAFGVHGLGGAFGAVATGLFATKAVNSAGADGLFYNGGTELLVKQLIGVGVAIAVAVIGTLIIASIIKVIMGLRVDQEEEQAGLDLNQHGEMAYSRLT